MSSHLVLISRSVLVLSQPSDVSNLVPSRLVLIIPTKSHVLPHHKLPSPPDNLSVVIIISIICQQFIGHFQSNVCILSLV